MQPLKFLGYITLYCGIGFGLHYTFTDQAVSLGIAIALIIVGGLILFFTAPVNSANNKKGSGNWLDILDWLDLPVELVGWLLKSVFKIFD